MSIPPPSRQVLELFAKAQAYHRSGQLGLAESHYLRVTKLDARNAEAWHLLGVAVYQMGKVDKAIAHYRRAVELRPRAAEMLNNLALALRARGDLAAAAETFARALQARPEYVPAAYNLGLLREQANDAAGAEQAYRQALVGEPDALNALSNLGNLLRRQGRLDEAERLLRRAQQRHPKDAAANGNLALLRLDQAQHAEACELATTAARIEPQSAQWWEALGTALRLAQDADAALAPLQRAATLAPDTAAIHLQLALALRDSGDAAGAEAAFTRALALQPNWERARWEQALSVPAVAADSTTVEKALAQFDAALAQLARDPGETEAAFEAAQAVGVFGMNYLPGDHTARQRAFGDLVGAVAARARPQYARPLHWRALAHGGRLRVGFVSAYLHRHVVERYFGGWIRDLDPARFVRHVWHTGAAEDERTEALRRSVDHFHTPRGSFDGLAAEIHSAQLDVLIYLDIGLDPRQHALAALRLAPVQCAAYGHPITTGLATIEHFLSGERLEPEHAVADYRENLVRLPGLGCTPEAPPLAQVQQPFASERPQLLCLQHLLKLPPDFDAVLAQILAGSGARLTLFSRSPGLSARYRQRLSSALRQCGLDPDDCLRIEPVRAYAEYLDLVQQADLVLDSPGFSGGGTSLDALGVGTPVLTLAGRFARGRQTAAMLGLLQLPQLVASDHADYVAKAVSLCADRVRRAEVRQQLLQRRDSLFHNPHVVPALQDFLFTAAQRAS